MQHNLNNKSNIPLPIDRMSPEFNTMAFNKCTPALQ